MMAVDNANPVVFEVAKQRPVTAEEEKDDVYDEIDAREVFDLIRHINDPEHPLTLEELNVVQEDLICINNKENFVSIHFTPTIPHCSMATLIGLSIRVCLLRSLPNRFKIDVIITPGSHMSEQAINKQLADKERIAAAIENSHLLNVVHQCLNTKRKQ